jgi:hypothetical protein
VIKLCHAKHGLAPPAGVPPRPSRGAALLRRIFAPIAAAAALVPGTVRAQAGPPFLTNDPGTPGRGNWEINVGSAQTVSRAGGSYQVPQLDLNFGLGDRLQLTYQIPYLIDTPDGGPRQSGWSNAFPGIKWRFLDRGEEGWQISTFPQVETAVSAHAEERGVAAPGPRFFLPIEASRKLGPVDVDVEAGYYWPRRGIHERVLGLVAGHSFSDRLELDAELYDDRASEGGPRYTLLDMGGRFKLSRDFIALFMAGRSVTGTGGGQPEFNGYLGIQILLSHHGLAPGGSP